MTTIATWNVNSIRTRLPHLEAWVKDRNPDVILLQEIKCQEETFPHEAVSDLGYNVSLWGQKSYNGVAILSKSPLEDLVVGLPTFPDDPQARYIEATVEGVRVASVYVPNGQAVGSGKFDYKMKFLAALAQHNKTLLTEYEDIVLGGDYNIAPFIDDGHNPEAFQKNRILCSLEEREKMRMLFNIGFVDGLRLDHPADLPEHKDLYTWWDYRTGAYGENRGYRIDHLLLSPGTADRTVMTGVDHEIRGDEKPSDHAPVWITLD